MRPALGGDLRQLGAVIPCRMGRTEGGLNSKPHATCGDCGRPRGPRLNETQVNEYAVRRYAARHARRARATTYLRLRHRPVPPSHAGFRHPPMHPRSSQPVNVDQSSNQIYRCRHEVGKGSRAIATRYDRCVYTFMSMIALATPVLPWRPHCGAWVALAFSSIRTLEAAF